MPRHADWRADEGEGGESDENKMGHLQCGSETYLTTLKLVRVTSALLKQVIVHVYIYLLEQTHLTSVNAGIA